MKNFEIGTPHPALRAIFSLREMELFLEFQIPQKPELKVRLQFRKRRRFWVKGVDARGERRPLRKDGQIQDHSVE